MAVNYKNWLKVNRLPGSTSMGIAVPGICYLCCGSLEHDDLLICAPCNKDLPVNTPACPHCALPVIVAGMPCGNCLRMPMQMKGNYFALYRYTFPISHMIHDLKYRARTEIAWFLGCRLAETIAVQKLPMPDCLVPVPLHDARIAARGFNQSLEIARSTGVVLNIPVNHTSCLRILHTPSQAQLTSSVRARNLKGAFEIRGKKTLMPAHVAIVDDVITTGSTVTELAAVLKCVGVERTDVWAAARTVPAAL